MALGRSARYTGRSADAYRPNGAINPLDLRNRFLRLPATFVTTSGGNRTNAYGDPLWHGVFDASYTQVGDYLAVGPDRFFIASQVHLLPILCVRANRMISIARPGMQTTTAENSYGGYISSSSVTIMENWPVSILAETRSGASNTDLPTDQNIPYWSLLMPALAGLTISPGDLVTDDLGRTAVIAGTELTDLGWRINAKTATT